MYPVRWDTLYSIGGEAEDTTLLRARLIAARDGNLYAYDFSDDRLKAFDDRGRLRWTFGRQGGGPGEFGNPTDLGVAPNGDVWITDAGAARTTVLTSDGALRRHIPFDGRPIMRTIPSEGRRLVFPTSPEHFWVALGEEGQVIEEGEFPTVELRDAEPVIRPPFVSMSPAGDVWAAVFPVADPLLVYRGRDLRCTGRLVEGGPFPDAFSRDTPIWAVGVTVSDTSVFVLARGQTEYELQLLDEYSAEDCRYVRTLLLPRKLQALAYDGGVFYFYYEDPAPAIVALRPVER